MIFVHDIITSLKPLIGVRTQITFYLVFFKYNTLLFWDGMLANLHQALDKLFDEFNPNSDEPLRRPAQDAPSYEHTSGCGTNPTHHDNWMGSTTPDSPKYDPDHVGGDGEYDPGWNSDPSGDGDNEEEYDPDSPDLGVEEYDPENSQWKNNENLRTKKQELHKNLKTIKSSANEITEDEFVVQRYLDPYKNKASTIKTLEEQGTKKMRASEQELTEDKLPASPLRGQVVTRSPEEILIRVQTPTIQHLALLNAIRQMSQSHVPVWAIDEVCFKVNRFCEANYTLDELTHVLQQLSVVPPQDVPEGVGEVVFTARFTGPLSAPNGAKWRVAPTPIIRPHPVSRDSQEDEFPSVKVPPQGNMLGRLVSKAVATQFRRQFPKEQAERLISVSEQYMSTNRMFVHSMRKSLEFDRVIHPKFIRTQGVPDAVQPEWLGCLRANDFIASFPGFQLEPENTKLAFCNPGTNVSVQMKAHLLQGKRHASAMASFTTMREEQRLHYPKECTVADWRRLVRACPRGVFRTCSVMLEDTDKVQLQSETDHVTGNTFDGSAGWIRPRRCDGCQPGKPRCGLVVDILPQSYLLHIEKTCGTSVDEVLERVRKDFDGWLLV